MRLLSLIAQKRGTSPIHANNPKLYLGNAKNRRSAEKMANRIVFIILSVPTITDHRKSAIEKLREKSVRPLESQILINDWLLSHRGVIWAEAIGFKTEAPDLIKNQGLDYQFLTLKGFSRFLVIEPQ